MTRPLKARQVIRYQCKKHTVQKKRILENIMLHSNLNTSNILKNRYNRYARYIAMCLQQVPTVHKLHRCNVTMAHSTRVYSVNISPRIKTLRMRVRQCRLYLRLASLSYDHHFSWHFILLLFYNDSRFCLKTRHIILYK